MYAWYASPTGVVHPRALNGQEGVGVGGYSPRRRAPAEPQMASLPSGGLMESGRQPQRQTLDLDLLLPEVEGSRPLLDYSLSFPKVRSGRTTSALRKFVAARSPLTSRGRYPALDISYDKYGPTPSLHTDFEAGLFDLDSTRALPTASADLYLDEGLDPYEFEASAAAAGHGSRRRRENRYRRRYGAEKAAFETQLVKTALPDPYGPYGLSPYSSSPFPDTPLNPYSPRLGAGLTPYGPGLGPFGSPLYSLRGGGGEIGGSDSWRWLWPYGHSAFDESDSPMGALTSGRADLYSPGLSILPLTHMQTGRRNGPNNLREFKTYAAYSQYPEYTN